MINSYIGLVKGINKNVASILVSCLLVCVKKLLRLIYEAPCLSHDSAASDLRDGKNPDEVVAANEARQQNIQGPLNSFLYFLVFVLGGNALYSAYVNFELPQYIITLAINVLVFAIINVIVSVLRGQYGKDREEFEKKYGALMYDGKYLHPKNISEVAEAIVKFHGGRQEALKHLDSKSQGDYYEYFCLNGEGDDDLFKPETIDMVRKNLACLNMDERMEEKYKLRFDGEKTFNPYDLESKQKLYNKVVNIGKL